MLYETRANFGRVITRLINMISHRRRHGCDEHHVSRNSRRMKFHLHRCAQHGDALGNLP